MAGYRTDDLILRGESQSITAGTNVVAPAFKISEHDARNLLVTVKFSALMENTGGAGSTIALQDSYDNGTTWAAVKTATAIATTAEVNTLTFPAVGGLTASEYIAIYDYAGNIWACMLDTTGGDADPTGAIWVAAGASRRTKTASLAGLSAAQVAAAVELAFDALTDVTDVITTDDTAADGTMTFTAVQAGVNLTKPVSKLADDSLAGAVTVAETTAGAYTATYEIENNMDGGTDGMIWPLARVVVILDTNDTATVSNVFVTRRT